MVKLKPERCQPVLQTITHPLSGRQLAFVEYDVYVLGMRSGFRWNRWNVEHIGEHGVDIDQAEYLVLSARPPWPSYEGDGRWLVRGQDRNGTYLQVAYVIDPDGTIYVIHARPLNDREKRLLRRRRK